LLLLRGILIAKQGLKIALLEEEEKKDLNQLTHP
jgi:hypothetical protein